ncbi:MAG: hypothetical protein ACREEM_53275 [Blastocatellia bacterium]
MKPQPDPSRGTEFGKALETGTDRADYRGVGVETHFAVRLAPDEAD